MDQANAVVKFGSRSTKTEARVIWNAGKFLRKDACDDGLADSDSDSTSDDTEIALAEFNDLAL